MKKRMISLLLALSLCVVPTLAEETAADAAPAIMPGKVGENKNIGIFRR